MKQREFRVRWTYEEERAVGTRAVDLIKTESMKLRAAVDKAQRLVLPPTRWRKVPTLPRELRRMVDELLGALAPNPPPPLVAAFDRPLPRPEPTTIVASSSSSSNVDVVAVLERLEQKIDRLETAIQALTPPPPEALVSAPTSATPTPVPTMSKPAPRERVLRVRVLGLLPDQLRAVQNKIGTRAQIEAWPRGGRPPTHCDLAIAVTGFIGHSQEQQLRRPGMRFIRAGRGVGNVIAIIRREMKGQGF